MWFQQDGVTAHTETTSMEVLQEMFPERVISLRGEFPWPALSSDPSTCDYFIWGYLKEKVYTAKPWTIEDLKIAIRK
jgi:hypothetical protein